MDLPVNSFKRAIPAGRLQIGLWSSLASHVTVEVIAGSGFDWLLLDTEHSPNELPMVHSQLQAAIGGTAPPDRPAAVERHGGDQALPRRRRAELPRPVRPDRGGGGRAVAADPLPAARRARLRHGLAGVALRAGQGLPHPLRGGDLRPGPDRDPAGPGQSGGHRRGRRASTASSSARATCRPSSAISATRATRRCRR